MPSILPGMMHGKMEVLARSPRNAPPRTYKGTHHVTLLERNESGFKCFISRRFFDRFLWILIAFSSLSSSNAICESISLTHQERLGKRIYAQGIGTAPIESNFVNSGIRAPASQYPCIQCHGESGQGGREAGVKIANIAPAVFAARNLAHGQSIHDYLHGAISSGIGASGMTLHPAMPRYQMTETDMSNLLAYLKRLGNEPVPGVTDNEIHIGMQLISGPLSIASSDVSRLLKAYFNEINQQGGIYGRKLVLDIFPSLGEEDSDAQNTTTNSIFCLIAQPPGSSPQHTQFEEPDIPVLAPMMIFPESEILKLPNVLYMYASFHDQGRVLVDFLNEKMAPLKTTALLYSDDAMARSGAEGVRQQSEVVGLSITLDKSISANEAAVSAIVDELQQKHIEQLIFFGSISLQTQLSQVLQSRKIRLQLFSSAELLSGGVAQQGFDETYLASSIGIPNTTFGEKSDYRRTVELAGLSSPQNPFLLNAFAGATVLIEALKLNGRALSRASFIRVLESGAQFKTGIGPTLRFSTKPFQGTHAVTILTIDPATEGLVTRLPFHEARKSR